MTEPPKTGKPDHLVAVITDSACDLTDTAAKDNGIVIVPLAIRFGEEEFIDRVELSTQDFWTRLGVSTELPTTAAPSSDAFELAFSEAKTAGATAVVCITLSSKLSATYQAAVKGAEAVRPDIEVHVVDSLLCTVAQGSLCLEASRQAKAGLPAKEIAENIEELKGRTHLYGTLDTLDNLRRGGRIGAAGAFFASLLSVKPVITIRDGEVQPESRQRTRKRALEHLARTVTENGPMENVAVAHSSAPDLEEFLGHLSEIADPGAIPVSIIGPVIGTHGGPRLVAVSFMSERPLAS